MLLQYIEWGSDLPDNPKISGIGERMSNLVLQNNKTYMLFSTDQPSPLHGEPLYGHHSFYIENRDSVYHGAFMLNSNAMDVALVAGKITYKMVGGVIDFFLFLGPEPASVVKQYHAVIGPPMMPPYWSLGFHQCRWGYKSLQDLEYVHSNYSTNEIPIDTFW